MNSPWWALRPGIIIMWKLRNIYKTCCQKMFIKTEGSFNAMFLHDCKTNSIGITEILVFIFNQYVLSIFFNFFVRIYFQNPRAWSYLVKKFYLLSFLSLSNNILNRLLVCDTADSPILKCLPISLNVLPLHLWHRQAKYRFAPFCLSGSGLAPRDSLRGEAPLRLSRGKRNVVRELRSRPPLRLPRARYLLIAGREKWDNE